MGAVSSLAELQSALRRELESDDLMELEEDFYVKVRKTLTGLHPTGKEPSSETQAVYMERARETLEKLFLLRLKKEIEHILRYGEKPKKRMPKEESEVLDNILKSLSLIIRTTPEEKPPSIKSKELTYKPEISDLVLVSFKKPYSKILIAEGMILGPFLPGDVAIIPRKVASELESSQILEIIMNIEV